MHIFVLWLLAGCDKESCQEVVVAGTPEEGDVNADGAVDISDGLYLQRWLFSGGPAPVCAERADVVPDGVVDAQDGVSLLRHVFTGSFALPSAPTCSTVEIPTSSLECGIFYLDFEVPRRVHGSFEATVTLTTQDLNVEGWQLGVLATGCSITAVTLAGTAGASTISGGLRQTGFAAADLVDGGAVSGVALSWLGETASPDELVRRAQAVTLRRINERGDIEIADPVP